MTQVSNVLQTAAFARRVVCRALTVLGGAAAGTALAWALSSTSASADIEYPALGSSEVPAAVQEAAAPVAEPVQRVVDAAVRQLQDPPPPPKTSIADLRDKVEGAFRAKPGLPDLVGAAEQRNYLTDRFGRSDLPSTPALVPATSSIVPGAVVDTAAPASAKERAFADGMSRRAGPEPTQPALPDLPDWPAPLPTTPAGIPTTGTQASAGNAADSHLFAALPWQDSITDLVAGGITAATDAATLGRVGAQPGVAPD